MSEVAMQILSVVLSAISVALFGWLISMIRAPVKIFKKMDILLEKWLSDSGSNKMWELIKRAAQEIEKAADEMIAEDSFPESKPQPKN